ncbi:MAG: hypothetical protein ACYCYK_09785, partial [Candidatus Dormibacteria bacterium]
MHLRLGRRRLDERAHPVDGQDLGTLAGVPGRVLGVTGSGGAPGRTFIGLNLAMALAEDGVRVSFVEAGSGLGTTAVRLNLKENLSLAYLAHEAKVRPLDEDLLARHLQRSGPLDLLVGTFEPDAAGMVPPEIFDSVVTMLSQGHELTVVDLGALDSHLAVAHALRCQTLCWVVSPTPVGVDLFDRVLRSAVANPLRVKPSLVVVNGTGAGTLAVNEAGFLRRYGMPLIASIPFNRSACLRAEASQKLGVAEGQLRAPLRVAAGAAAAQLFQQT